MWEFKKLAKSGNRVTEITVSLTETGLFAIADDDHYHGDLNLEESIALGRAVLEKLDRVPQGQHARVIDGPMCGGYGPIVGHVRETGHVILRDRDELLIVPQRFVRTDP